MRDRGQPCPWCRCDIKWRTDEAMASSNIISTEGIAQRRAADETMARRLAADMQNQHMDDEAARNLAASASAAALAADEEFARALAADMVGAAPVPPPPRPPAVAPPALEEVPELPDGIKQVSAPTVQIPLVVRRLLWCPPHPVSPVPHELPTPLSADELLLEPKKVGMPRCMSFCLRPCVLQATSPMCAYLSVSSVFVSGCVCACLWA
jgi:hypothetical protein